MEQIVLERESLPNSERRIRTPLTHSELARQTVHRSDNSESHNSSGGRPLRSYARLQESYLLGTEAIVIMPVDFMFSLLRCSVAKPAYRAHWREQDPLEAPETGNAPHHLMILLTAQATTCMCRVPGSS
jgi:hypothetical protein